MGNRVTVEQLSSLNPEDTSVGVRKFKQGELSHGELLGLQDDDPAPQINWSEELLNSVKMVLDAATSWNAVKEKIQQRLPNGKLLHNEICRKLLKQRGVNKAEEIIKTGKIRDEVLRILDTFYDEVAFEDEKKDIENFLNSQLNRRWYISLKDTIRRFPESNTEIVSEAYAPFKKKFLLLPDVPEHNNIVYSVVAAKQTNLIVSGSDDCTARFWRLTDDNSLRCIAAVNINTGINRVSLSDDGQTLAIATNEGSIQLLDVTNLTSLRQLQGKRRTAEAWAVKFGPLNSLATGGVDCAVRLWDVRSMTCYGALKGHKQWVNGVAFPPAGRILASCSGDKTVRLWDVGEMACVGVLEGHDNFVRGIGFARKHELVTCSDDRTVRVWNLFESKQVRVMRGHAACVYDLSVNLKKRVVCTASQDSTLRMWNIDTGVCLSTLVGHRADVNSVHFVDGANYVTSGSDDFTVRVWKCQYPD